MWSERVGNWAWLVEHIVDVRSDMSRFHRIDDVEAMRSDRLMEFASRLAAYDGVVANRVRREANSAEYEEAPDAVPVEQIAANPSPQELMALNNTALYGPLQGEEVGLFNVRIIGGEDA
jgi:hypothetical protein